MISKREDPMYRRCTRCVMDTTDPAISFDAQGVCNHCREFDASTSKLWFPNGDGRKRLEAIFDKVKADGKGREYDCIMGLSGGVDSSYLALMVHEYGLRPLVVHVDAGWNSELAVHNIERLVKHCGYDLHTHVMAWDEIRDLQLAYLKAGVPNIDVVQDHAFFASLYRFAVQNGIRYVLSGTNIATESIMPKAWLHPAMDAVSLRAIHRAFGEVKLRQFKTISFFEYFFYFPFVRKMTVLSPLNYLPYRKEEALQTLIERVGYKPYGRKHGESRFTRFFQEYYLPQKFGIDERLGHLSSRIVAGCITREQALEALEEPLYDPAELAADKAYVAKKLGISVPALDALIAAPPRHHTDFANWDRQYQLMRSVRAFMESQMGRRVRTYS